MPFPSDILHTSRYGSKYQKLILFLVLNVPTVHAYQLTPTTSSIDHTGVFEGLIVYQVKQDTPGGTTKTVEVMQLVALRDPCPLNLPLLHQARSCAPAPLCPLLHLQKEPSPEMQGHVSFLSLLCNVEYSYDMNCYCSKDVKFLTFHLLCNIRAKALEN